ncbi:MAG: sterol desaturase family protein [Flavobacteriales bacterium]|nr:sterol desaturase family protein [Flavobacteriales bacterium]
MMFVVALILAFGLMEFAAWSAHKYLMHGFLWKIHEDHHKVTPRFFEKNDLFFLIFAIPSWLCIMLGFIYEVNFSIGFGFGIALYGIVYFLVHDVLIHRRFKWFDKTNNAYFRAIRKAHKIHHKNQEKEDGECFGMLIVPRKYFQS